MKTRPLVVGCCGWISLLVFAAGAGAAPNLANLSLRGLQSGGTTSVALDGSELGPDTRILLDVPVASQTVKPGATATHVEIDIALDAQVPAGIYLLRVAGPTGVSTAVPIGIDALPQLPLAAEAPQLPVALSGSLEGSTVSTVAFSGKKAERFVAEVESRRLGANLSPTVRLYDARHVQIAWSQPLAILGGDARLDVALPADGRYSVELHDALFRGAAPGFFRLKLGDFKYADLVYPLGVVAGSQTPLELLASNLPAESKPATIGALLGEQPAPWPAGIAPLSGSRPKQIVSAAGELVEQPAAEQPQQQQIVSAAGELVEQPAAEQPQQLGAAPVAVSGRLLKRGEQDRYQVAVTPGQQLRIDVLASRVGSSLDGVLTVLNEQGGQIGASDDRPGTSDPGLDLTVPGDSKIVTLVLRDLEGRGGDAFLYRISIRPLVEPEFSLTAADDRWLVPRDGALVVPVKVERSNYQGPILLEFKPQAANLVVTGSEIPAGANETLLSLSAPGLEPVQLVSRLVGRGVEAAATVERRVTAVDSPALKFQPWLRGELGLAVTPPGPLVVAWEDFTPETKLQMASSLPIKVRIARAAGVTGSVRIALLTTQPMPKKTIKENNQDKVVDDVEHSLRLEATTVIAPDQNEAIATILVPVDLPLASYDLAVKAELLAADNQNVAATAFAPARRLGVLPPEKPPAEQPLAVFEDQAEFVTNLNSGTGQVALDVGEKYSGTSSVKVTPDQRYSELLPGLGVKIREKPGPGEYRYLQFAWRKQGGQNLCLQLNHDGTWGPAAPGAAKFRYHAGPGPECYSASVAVSPTLPEAFALVTRDLFADFGEFTLNGLALSPVDGEFALFDHIYLGRAPADFDLIKP